MTEADGRSLLAKGQQSLARGDLPRARAAFEAAANRFSGPSELLGGGHGWRGAAQIASIQGEVDDALRILERAERIYQLGRELLADTEDPALITLRLDLVEGLATCGAMRADLALRRGRHTEARHAIDAVYPLYRELGERPSVANLWMTTARLAEREGRWFSARTAWAQVLRVRKANNDESGQCDALIRMSDALLAEDDVVKARKKLEEAEELARNLEDDALVGRVRIGFAKILEQEHDWEGAWEKWLDADQALRDADPMLRGLSQVRMARTAVRVRPLEAGELLERGLVALLEARHSDAIGLVLHQLAVVSLVQGDGRTALLAAVGADRARGGDDSLQGVIVRALMRLEAYEAAWLVAIRRRQERGDDDLQAMVDLLADRLENGPPVDPEDAPALNAAVESALDAIVAPIARSRGLAADEIGTRRAAMTLCASATDSEAQERAATATPAPVARIGQPAAAATDITERPVLVWELQEGTQEYHPLPVGLTLLGRGPDNAVRMGWDGMASRTHCSVEYDGTEIRIRDLDSHHGTFVDDVQVDGEVVLPRGSVLRVGETDFGVEWRLGSANATVRLPAAIAIPVENRAT